METPHHLLTPRAIGSTGVRTFPVAFDASVLGWVTGVEVADEVLGRFADSGGTLISTAGHYAGGRSEMMIGTWLAKRDRSSMLIATRVGRNPDDPGLSRRAIERSIETSLERLRTDYVDFLALDGEVLPEDPSETLETVTDLVKAGSVRFISTTYAESIQVRRLLDVAAEHGLTSLSAVATEYNLMVRRAAETAMLPLAAERGLGFFARFPLASGFLSGRIQSAADLPENALFDGALQHIGRRGTRVLAALQKVATEHETTTDVIAVAWLLSKPGVSAAVVRMYDLDAVQIGFGGSEVALTRHQIAELDAASA